MPRAHGDGTPEPLELTEAARPSNPAESAEAMHAKEPATAPEAHAALLAFIKGTGAACAILEHAPARTIDDARKSLDLDITRIIKTIAFALRDETLVLAALRGTRRVDYAKLAALSGVNRRDLRALSPAEVEARLGVAPGGVSPALPKALGLANVLLSMDADALSIAPTAYCGLGRADRTLEMDPQGLAALCGARAGVFSKE